MKLGFSAAAAGIRCHALVERSSIADTLQMRGHASPSRLVTIRSDDVFQYQVRQLAVPMMLLTSAYVINGFIRSSVSARLPLVDKILVDSRFLFS